MGCDEPLSNGKVHELPVGDDTIVLDTCPRKMMREVQGYLRAYNWAKQGRLNHLYGEDDLPAHVGQALDLIESEDTKKLERITNGS